MKRNSFIENLKCRVFIQHSMLLGTGLLAGRYLNLFPKENLCHDK